MQQTTLDLISNNQDLQKDFIESSSNTLACQYINNWQDKFGVLPYTRTLIIQGAKSCGKTFLAQLWAKKTGALFIKKNHTLTNTILEHHKTFVIDDLNTNWREEDVLHYFNLLHEHHKYLLITLNALPKFKLPDLKSRLHSVNKINILMPDDELMKMLIFKQFSNFSITVSDEVINYLIRFIPREFSYIISVIEKINIASLEQKRRITVPFVKQVVENLLQIR